MRKSNTESVLQLNARVAAVAILDWKLGKCLGCVDDVIKQSKDGLYW